MKISPPKKSCLDSRLSSAQRKFSRLSRGSADFMRNFRPFPPLKSQVRQAASGAARRSATTAFKMLAARVSSSESPASRRPTGRSPTTAIRAKATILIAKTTSTKEKAVGLPRIFSLRLAILWTKYAPQPEWPGSQPAVNSLNPKRHPCYGRTNLWCWLSLLDLTHLQSHLRNPVRWRKKEQSGDPPVEL